MSKYIETIPLSKVERISVVQGNGRSLAQVKTASGADLVMNGGFYDFGTGKPTNHLKSGGAVLARERWGCWGFSWDTGADIRMEALPAGERRNYIGGVELLSPMTGAGDKPQYGKELGGKRGRTAMALTGNDLILYCSGDGTKDGRTPEALQEELYELGAEAAIMLDGGGSSQCDLGGRKVISSARRVNNYICVWLKKEPEKEEKPVSSKKTVCLDPGHGPDTVNGSPDGAYKEREFTWDMYTRIKPLLERQGIEVVVTRREDDKPSLTERAEVSNRAGADLFVSLHSNAAGSGGWYDGARGLLIYTSAPPETAGRNVAARTILAQMREAGISISGSGLLHQIEYTVLTKTSAPAVLIEYGFHTSRADVALLKDGAYRERLAEATARGVCGFLGVSWTDAPKPETPGQPWYAGDQTWVKDMGVSDGTRPEENVTRAEAWAMLHKFYEAVKAGK